MTYTARIVEAQRQDGQLRVIVEYTNGTAVVRDSMTTKSAQDGDWIAREARRRTAELDGLEMFAAGIVAGPIDLMPPEPPVTTPRERYAAKLTEFRWWTEALRNGFAPVAKPEFVAARQWLMDNFDVAYLDLFG